MNSLTGLFAVTLNRFFPAGNFYLTHWAASAFNLASLSGSANSLTDTSPQCLRGSDYFDFFDTFSRL
jgi:hypothetical protein